MKIKDLNERAALADLPLPVITPTVQHILDTDDSDFLPAQTLEEHLAWLKIQ